MHYTSALMSTIDTKYFGMMPFDPEACFELPNGLPAFEEERRFLLIQLPDHEPLVFLQSAVTPSLCFIALPVLVADPAYDLAINAEDLAQLDLDPSRQPIVGSEVLVLALLSIREEEPATANLLAPVVMNLANRRAVQAIRHDRAYSHEQPMSLRKAESSC